MNLAPSIYSLYRRSRYARTEANSEVASLQSRREVFAVAAVALTLKHDPHFQKHFLNKVCNIDRYDPKTLQIKVQPAHHADLELTLANPAKVIVVEFKIGAELQPHQNPAQNEFITGYCEALRCYNATYKSYVAIANFPLFNDRPRKGIHCFSKTWNDLIASKVSGLWADLLDSLGTLGIPALQFGELKNMKLKEHTRSAVSMHKVLASVATISNLALEDPDISSDGDDSWYGFNIARHIGRDFLTLSHAVGSVRNESGWYGYESRKDRCNLAVYFYCGTQEAAAKTRAFLEERLNNNCGKLEFVDDTGVVIRNNSRKATGDAEWFQSIFSALKEKTRRS